MTAQTPEEFVYKGKRYSVTYTEPLGQYLQTQNFDFEFNPIASSCWRGYRGLWCISNNKLYLTDFSGAIRIYIIDDDEFSPERTYETKNIRLNDLFPNQQKVFAEWYSGEIKLGKGFVKSDYDNFETLYSKETFLKFKDGVLIESKIVRNHISFYDRIPRYLKLIYESDSGEDLTFLDTEDSLLNKKSSKPFKEQLLSLLRMTIYTLIVSPFAIIQMVIISVEYIYDNILFKIAKYT